MEKVTRKELEVQFKNDLERGLVEEIEPGRYRVTALGCERYRLVLAMGTLSLIQEFVGRQLAFLLRALEEADEMKDHTGTVDDVMEALRSLEAEPGVEVELPPPPPAKPVPPMPKNRPSATVYPGQYL